MVAASPTKRFTLLLRRIAPVRNSPLGTTTRPPPALLQAAIALAKAPVLSVELSPFAPNFVISKSRLGKTGGLMRARIRGTSDQGSVSAAKTSIAGTASAAAPPAAIDFRN